MKPFGRWFLVASAVALCAALGTLQASQVRAVNLEDMTERAETIFAGRCVRVKSMHDPQTGRRVTQATFEVHRAVKGEPGPTITVKLLGGIVGQPRFVEGEEVVLFLYGESALGLSSPVGFGQGKFSIIETKHGRTIAVNEFGNRNLMKGLSSDAQARLGLAHDLWKNKRELDSGALLDMVEQLRP